MLERNWVNHTKFTHFEVDSTNCNILIIPKRQNSYDSSSVSVKSRIRTAPKKSISTLNMSESYVVSFVFSQRFSSLSLLRRILEDDCSTFKNWLNSMGIPQAEGEAQAQRSGLWLKRYNAQTTGNTVVWSVLPSLFQTGGILALPNKQKSTLIFPCFHGHLSRFQYVDD